MLMVPEQRRGWKGHPSRTMNHVLLLQGRYLENFTLYLNGKCLKKGGQEGGYLEDVEGSWPETWRTCSFMMSWMMFFILRKIPWKVCVYILIRSVSRRGGHEEWYLEDIEGSWPETWRTWLFLTSWMMFFTPMNIPWKFCVDSSIRSVSILI